MPLEIRVDAAGSKTAWNGGWVDTLENEGRCSVNIIDFGEDTLKNDGKCSNMTNLLGVDALKRG